MSVKRKTLSKIIIIVSILFVLAAIVYIDFVTVPKGSINPYLQLLLSKEQKDSLNSIKRLNEEGTLYQMDYYADYTKPFYKLAMFLVRNLGCTAFSTSTESGDVLMCRNYDCPWFDDEGNLTGLNVFLRLNPEGKYSSINMIDGAWGAKAGLPYFSGSLDDGKTNTIVMLLAPYLCMDGMNEKGLASSIQYLDVKEGSKPVKQKEKGKETINIIQANRFVLDNCASIDEAVELLSGYNLSNLSGNDYHLFMTERSGRSAIIEWVENKMVVSEVDASTNFYLTLDDAADCWYEEGLKEAWNGPAETVREYHYGYGHGYERFKTVVSFLDSKLTDDNRTIMTEEEALSLLAQTRQEYINKLSSQSLYSAIYNLTDLTLDIWVFPEFDQKYSFSFAK